MEGLGGWDPSERKDGRSDPEQKNGRLPWKGVMDGTR